MREISPNDPCPCTSGKKYKKCCRPYHNGVTIPSPTELVRARFSAYALADIDFIMETTHPESPHIEKESRWRSSLEAYILRTYYQSLEILEAEGTMVKYRAHVQRLGQGNASFSERSNFRQENGKWYYFDGTFDEIKEANEADSEA